MYLLGIDLGTTGCKSMVFETDGTILGGDYIEYELKINKEGHIDQDANIWWEHVKSSIKKTIAQADIDGCQIGALSISSQGIAFVPVDEKGNTLMDAISWLDNRAGDEIAEIRRVYDEKDMFALTGKRLSGGYMFPKLMWIKKHRPEVYAKTAKFLMGHDFLIYRFSGEMVTDLSMASGTLAFDVVKHAWYEDIFRRFDIDMDKMPRLGELGEVVGKVLPQVAQELGLSPETLVVMGAQDQRCASFGAGIEQGIVTVSLGTATAVCSQCDRPIIDDRRLVTCCGLTRDQWMLESVVGTSGVALKWVKNTFFEQHSFKELDELAESAQPGANGVLFLPHLSSDGDSCHGTFSGMGLQTQKSDIIRAVLEGIAFEIRLHIESHERLNGKCREIRLFGGGAKSEIWCRIIADITGRDVVLTRTHETGNMGAAILAGLGAGAYKSIHEAAKLMGIEAKRIVPDAPVHESYRPYYENYVKLYNTMG